MINTHRAESRRPPLILVLAIGVLIIFAINEMFTRVISQPTQHRRLADRYADLSAGQVALLTNAMTIGASKNTGIPVDTFNQFTSAQAVSSAFATNCNGDVHMAKDSNYLGQPLSSLPKNAIHADLSALDLTLYQRVIRTGAPVSHTLSSTRRYEIRPMPCTEASLADGKFSALIVFFDWSYMLKADQALLAGMSSIDKTRYLLLGLCICLIMGTVLFRRYKRFQNVLLATTHGDFSTRYHTAPTQFSRHCLGQNLDRTLSLFQQRLNSVQDELDTQILGRRALDASGDGLCLFSKDQLAIEINQQYSALTGYNATEIIGRSLLSMLPEDLKELIENEQQETLIDKYSSESWGSRKTGSRYRRHQQLSLHFDENGAVKNYILSERDITKEYQRHNFLEQSIKTDTLTGLPNREQFSIEFEHSLGAEESGIAIGIFDVDHMREINAEYSMHVGDMIVKEVGRRFCLALVGTLHSVFRKESGEFFVLFRGVKSARDLERRAQSLMSNICGEASVDGWKINITAGMGIAMFDARQHQDATVMLQDADAALRYSKKPGKPRVVIAQEYLLASQRQRAKLSLALKSPRLIEQLRLIYLPKVDVITGKVVGAESTIRWYNPELSHVNDTIFLETAKKTGDILRIGDWVVEQALRDAKQFSVQVPGFQLSIPIPIEQLQKPFFGEQFANLLLQNNVLPTSIALEVDLGEKLKNAEAVKAVTRSLKSIGVKIQIKDADISFSTFSTGSQLSVDILKIDKSFIDRIDQSPTNLSMLKKIVAQAQLVGIKVIVEGIENVSQYRLLKELQCDYCYGYLYAEPISLSDGESARDLISNWQRSAKSIV